MDCRHDWGGNLEAADDSSDEFEVDGIETECFRCYIAKSDGVTQDLAIAK
jgi:hypothetical protein